MKMPPKKEQMNYMYLIWITFPLKLQKFVHEQLKQHN
jgi:hypothetical protein